MLIRVFSFIFDLLMNWKKCYRKLNFLCIGENSFIAIKFNPSSVFFFSFFFLFFYQREKERIEPPLHSVEETAGNFGTKLYTSKYLFNTDIKKVFSVCVCVCVCVCLQGDSVNSRWLISCVYNSSKKTTFITNSFLIRSSQNFVKYLSKILIK